MKQWEPNVLRIPELLARTNLNMTQRRLPKWDQNAAQTETAVHRTVHEVDRAEMHILLFPDLSCLARARSPVPRSASLRC